MTINLNIPDIRELKPRITVFGVGGAGGNAVNNMITAGLQGVDFVVANTDAQALTMSKAERVIQMGVQVTEGLGAGSQPDVGRAAAEEVIDEIRDHLSGAHMVFVTAGMGGGTGTGAAPVIAKTARELGILTVGVVTKPFHFEGQRRMRLADGGITELQKCVDTLLIIPNQNLFRVANEKTTFADAFALADQVLYSGVACITDLMVKEGLINLDFADVRAVMREMGKAMMGTGEAQGDKRAMTAAEAAISNPLIDDASMKGARGLLISITGGRDLTLYEVDEAATRIREEVDQDANIIVGATFDESLDGMIRVSVVATGIDQGMAQQRPATTHATHAAPAALPATHGSPSDSRLADLAQRIRADNQRIAERIERTEAATRTATAPAAPAAPAAAPVVAQPVAAPATLNASIESAAKAAIASAVEDITIRP
ncbi:MAG: cell division protein FtsZ, partial [Xanthobacteraceae bacterium]